MSNSLRYKANSNAPKEKFEKPRRKSDPAPRFTPQNPKESSALKVSTMQPDENEQMPESRNDTTLLRTILLLTLIVAQVFADVPGFSMCHNEHAFTKRDYHAYAHQKRQTQDVMGQLYEWCSSDSDCAEAYHITTNRSPKDEKAFRYISKTWLHMTDSTVDLMRPFNETVCENASFDDLLKTLWIVAMRLNVKETIRLECGANERAVFDTETMQMHCVCISDRNCLDASEWRASSANWSNVTVSIAIAVLLVVLVQQLLLNISRRRTFHRLLLECKKNCGGKEAFRKEI